MDISIKQTPFTVALYGFSGIAVNKEYGRMGMQLMDRMWKEVKQRNIKNKGINCWVYLPNHEVFTGVELEGPPPAESDLEHRVVTLEKYAYYKHIGPYHLLAQVYAGIRNEISARGLTISSPGMEIYGHWHADESKLETEILIAVE